MFLIAAALLGLGASPSEAAHYSPSTPEFQFTGASFTKVPSTSEARAAYPSKLRATTSSVVLKCVAGEHGVLRNCEIKLADPDLSSLKAAALKLSRYFRVSSDSPASPVMVEMQFSGRVWRCLMPFCMPDLIQVPPIHHDLSKPPLPSY